MCLGFHHLASLGICLHLPSLSICLLKVNDRNIRTRCEICSKLTIKTPERCQWHCSGVFIINFDHISHFVLVFLLLTLTCNCWLGRHLYMVAATKTGFTNAEYQECGSGRNFVQSGLDGKSVLTALACPCTCHIKNTSVVYHTPKTLDGVFSQLFLIHSLSTFIITFFLIFLIQSFVRLYSTFFLLSFADK